MNQQTKQKSQQKNTNTLLMEALNATLTIILISVVIYATIKGHYTDRQIIEVCNGIQQNTTTHLLNLTGLK